MRINIQLIFSKKVKDEFTIPLPSGVSFQNVVSSIKHALSDSTVISQPSESSFPYFIGKSWAEIKDIFHYNWIIYHKKHSSSGGDLITNTGMPKPTFYSLHRRLTRVGYTFPDFRKKKVEFPEHLNDEPLQSYIESLVDKTWNSANQQFSEDVMRFLYHQYGYNKTKLSEILKLGYSAVIQKTRSITCLSDKSAKG